MNEQELREKIIEIIAPYVSAWGEDKAIADALIAAGMGDVKGAETERKAYEVASNYYRIHYEEQKHRAEVAERALRNAAPRLKCRGGLGKGFCKVDKCDYYHCNNDDGCVKSHLEQAEKELAGEEKE